MFTALTTPLGFNMFTSEYVEDVGAQPADVFTLEDVGVQPVGVSMASTVEQELGHYCVCSHWVGPTKGRCQSSSPMAAPLVGNGEVPAQLGALGWWV